MHILTQPMYDQNLTTIIQIIFMTGLHFFLILKQVNPHIPYPVTLHENNA
jgi:hypothetical protein